MTTEKFKPKMKDWVQKTVIWSGEGLKEWNLSLKEVKYLFDMMNKERDDLSDINFIFEIKWLKKVSEMNKRLMEIYSQEKNQSNIRENQMFLASRLQNRAPRNRDLDWRS